MHICNLILHTEVVTSCNMWNNIIIFLCINNNIFLVMASPEWPYWYDIYCWDILYLNLWEENSDKTKYHTLRRAVQISTHVLVEKVHFIWWIFKKTGQTEFNSYYKSTAMQSVKYRVSLILKKQLHASLITLYRWWMWIGIIFIFYFYYQFLFLCTYIPVS